MTYVEEIKETCIEFGQSPVGMAEEIIKLRNKIFLSRKKTPLDLIRAGIEAAFEFLDSNPKHVPEENRNEEIEELAYQTLTNMISANTKEKQLLNFLCNALIPGE